MFTGHNSIKALETDAILHCIHVFPHLLSNSTDGNCLRTGNTAVTQIDMSSVELKA